MSLLRWGMGGDFDHVTGLYWDTRLVGYRKTPAWQWAKLPRYRAWRGGWGSTVHCQEEATSLWGARALRWSSEGESDDDGNPQSRWE